MFLCRVVVQGPGPGPRYGHVMALVGQRFLLTIGGNDGKQLLPDAPVKFKLENLCTWIYAEMVSIMG